MARFAAIILGLTVLGASTQVLAQAVPSNVVPYPGPKPDPLLTANPTMVLSGASPPPRLSLGINPSGATGPSEVFYNVLYSGAQYDTVDASQAPINPATLKINTNYGGTAKGGRTALRIAVNPTGPMVRTGTEVFNVGAEIFSTAGSNVGGTDDNAGAIGQIVPINTVGQPYESVVPARSTYELISLAAQRFPPPRGVSVFAGWRSGHCAAPHHLCDAAGAASHPTPAKLVAVSAWTSAASPQHNWRQRTF